MKFDELVLATTNKAKINELKTLLNGVTQNILSLSSFPTYVPAKEVGKTFDENAIIKAKQFYEVTGKFCIAEDSGLEIDALGGQPGIHSARYLGEYYNFTQRMQYILQKMEHLEFHERTARFKAVIVLCGPNLPEEGIITEGILEGYIASEMMGKGGFGYDPIFCFDASQHRKTTAMISQKEKNDISHRGKASRLMVNEIGKLFD